MAQKIVDTALLVCNKGTVPSSLSVTSQSFHYTENKLTATEKDKKLNVNIKPFGLCKLKPTIGGYLSCAPSPIAWQDVTVKDEINGYKLLKDISECPCAVGGKISVKSKGHSENHETE